MPRPEPMMCPDCGIAMNRHAEKLEYWEDPVEHGGVDLELGGILAESHTCPRCGQTAARKTI